MAVETPAQNRIDRASTDDRVLHLSAYVERPFDAVLEAFATAQIDEILALAVQAALKGSDGALVSAHASTPVWVSASHARVPVAWCSTGSDGGPNEGTADLSLLVVQSGQDAVTELLVALPVSHADAASATVIMHRVLDEITARLEDDTH